MYIGKHVKKTKKSIAIYIVLIMLITAAVGTTVAYINHSSGPAVNSFELAEVTCEIDETVEGGVKSSVKVENTGETAAYIRVAVVANTVDGEGNITGAADVSSKLAAENWVKNGSYYYYKLPVAPDAKTGELLKGSIDLDGIQVTVLAEAIQSKPKDAAVDAWGVDPSAL